MSEVPSRRDPLGEGADRARARRMRSFGIALLLVAFAALVFVVTVMRLGGHG